MPTSHIVQLFLALGTGTALVAFWKGGPAERLGALLILINISIFVAAGYVLSTSVLAVLLLIDDGLTALGLLAITLRYANLWLGGCMLLYAVQFSLHAFYLVADKTPDNLHAVVNNLDFMGVIVCIAVGTLVAVRRRIAARSGNRDHTHH